MRYASRPPSDRVDAFTDWAMSRIDELVAVCDRPPLIVPLTVTFAPQAVYPNRVLIEFERFYVRLCRLLMNNPDRASKRPLLPFALAFRDDPSTRPDKPPSAHHVFFNHPAAAPHVHSLIVIHPTLSDRFRMTADTLEATWRQIPSVAVGSMPAVFRSLSRPLDQPRYLNRSLHIPFDRVSMFERLMTDDYPASRPLIRADIRNWIDYPAKLMRRRDIADDDDLFTVLPSYTKTASTVSSNPWARVGSIDQTSSTMALAGHASLTATSRYIEVDAETQSKLVNII